MLIICALLLLCSSLNLLMRIILLGGSKSSKKQTSGSSSNVISSSTADIDREDISGGSGDEDLGRDDDNLEEGHSGEKQVRETERRYANNARER